MLKYTELFRIFVPKLVLEVFGGGGAIWGFSEAVGFRTPMTVWAWRPAALTVGAIFFVRWLLQINDFVEKSKDDIEKPSVGEETKTLVSNEEYGTTMIA